jgi:NifU-like protein involved in Fe-S cluster formation
LATAQTLYNREVLALATSLASWPLYAALPVQGEARSALCGSRVALGLAVDGAGRIEQIGLQVQACAIGQASAALFAQAAPGRSLAEIEAALAALSTWLAHGGALPDWPGLGAIAAARDYPARHGAVMLAWQAARDALFTAAKPG